ncbi:hypothetical protein J5N97_000626 [Dioscorea zingiberensis]|uniref:Beta-galactosidase n=1 Tax=Dioscorea zingiberensis TaxID=325984 RepID=A0A9D5BS13_9LILI|nr:hypothetical protein J5N97_000626 [Dioscorea zingiberensis]
MGLRAQFTYDSKALVIDGQREDPVLRFGQKLLGSPRKGLDVIETYVFWNYHEPEEGSGFPMWLHCIPGVQFRTTNKQFQIENEYGNVEWAYGIGGALYVKWAASTAVALNTTVPWVMCSQEDAPDPIVSLNQVNTGLMVATSE